MIEIFYAYLLAGWMFGAIAFIRTLEADELKDEMLPIKIFIFWLPMLIAYLAGKWRKDD